MAQQTFKPFQSIQDTANLTGFSVFSLRKRVREGTVKFTRSGKKFYINIPDLLKREGLSMADLERNTPAE